MPRLLRLRYHPHADQNRPAPARELWRWMHIKELNSMLDHDGLCFSALGASIEAPVSKPPDTLNSAENSLRILGDLESMRRVFVSSWYMSDPQSIANSSPFGNDSACVGTTYDRLIRSINHASTDITLAVAEGRCFSDGLVEYIDTEPERALGGLLNVSRAALRNRSCFEHQQEFRLFYFDQSGSPQREIWVHCILAELIASILTFPNPSRDVVACVDRTCKEFGLARNFLTAT